MAAGTPDFFALHEGLKAEYAATGDAPEAFYPFVSGALLVLAAHAASDEEHIRHDAVARIRSLCAAGARILESQQKAA